MRSFNEQEPIYPDYPELDYTPLRLSERAAKLGPLVSQAARPEPIRSSSMSRPASLVPKATSETARRTRDLDRAARQSVARSTPSDTTGSTAPSNQEDVESKPALAELKALPSPPAPHEQS